MSQPPDAIATYRAALPTARDRLRFAVGDTNVAAALLVDVTYDAILAGVNNDERLATVVVCDALISRYAQEPTRAEITGVESAEWRDRLSAWKGLAARLRAEATQEATRAQGTFSVQRPQRYDEEVGEYTRQRRHLPPEGWD